MSTASPIADAPPALTVAVRTLCEFGARRGDLDLRFTPSATALEGMAGHAEVSARRAPPYQRELALSGRFRDLTVRGRADGWDPTLRRVEEIKTHRGDLARQPAQHRHLHWAQARVYAWLLCEQEGLSAVDVALVYFDVATGQETVLCEPHDAAALRRHFEDLCGAYLDWARQEAAHRAARDGALAALPFPHDTFRAGQRALAEAVYRAHRSGRCLMAQAPTGIGKTVATLYPALRASPGRQIDKLLYLTARTPGRQLALDALDRLRVAAPAWPVRVLELVAREKACEHPDKACHGESCPLAHGFYDRLPAARAEAIGLPQQSRDALRGVALAHSVCPYYLAQALVPWADVLVGDYNHFFDLSAMLYGLTVTEGWRVSVLVDEAHNLVERARRMYSAELDQRTFREARRVAPASLAKALARVQRPWSALVRGQAASYSALDEPPAPLVRALQALAAELGDHFADPAQRPEPRLQALYFAVLQFLRVAELHGPHALFDVNAEPAAGDLPARGTRRSVLCLRNVVPAPLLAARWAAAHAVTLFSATLGPPEYPLALLGLPADTVWLDVPSPFEAAQLELHIARHVSTRYSDRGRSLDALVGIMATQYRRRPGNYLAFFSSFEYLQQAAECLAARHPDVAQWAQSRGMDEPSRDAFLARFTPQGQGIGFAVLGGAFAEGIDLPGQRLIGAFIATLGLPQVNPVNEQIRSRVQALLGHGYDYTYLFPGLQKVVQAAGRVIRTPQDHGVIWLLDDRFGRPEIRRLLPAWWPPADG